MKKIHPVLWLAALVVAIMAAFNSPQFVQQAHAKPAAQSHYARMQAEPDVLYTDVASVHTTGISTAPLTDKERATNGSRRRWWAR